MSAPKPWRPDDGGCAASSDDVVSDRSAAATSGSLLPVHVEGWQGFVDGPPLCQRTFRRWVSMWASSAAIDAIYVEGPKSWPASECARLPRLCDTLAVPVWTRKDFELSPIPLPVIHFHVFNGFLFFSMAFYFFLLDASFCSMI